MSGAIVRSNLWLRSADRVYSRWGEFPATEFEDLLPADESLAVGRTDPH